MNELSVGDWASAWDHAVRIGEHADISYKEMARAVGVDRSTFARWGWTLAKNGYYSTPRAPRRRKDHGALAKLLAHLAMAAKKAGA